MVDNLPKKIEDDLNFKAVLLRLFNNKNLKNKWFWHHRDWPSFCFYFDLKKKSHTEIHSVLLTDNFTQKPLLIKSFLMSHEYQRIIYKTLPYKISQVRNR